MRFMILVKADKNSEAGVLPDQKLLADMGKYNEELVKAGVMLAGEGLQPSSKGARVRFSGDKRIVRRRTLLRDQGADRRLLDTPGEIEGRGDRVGQARPNPMPGTEPEIEIRQVFEADDFGRRADARAQGPGGAHTRTGGAARQEVAAARGLAPRE